MSQTLNSQSKLLDNPCISCGACCSYFRVSFYWAEAEDGGGTVPVSRTEKLNDFMRCMKGTNEPRPRCINLCGEIGKSVSCSIYHNRPSPCREFPQAWETNDYNENCDRARAAHGLPPLPKPQT
ncbi:YkgJ family cysteine cluster protein [Xenorhabdus mauleonii]|uniref:YkgJ family cysteine cluster protein n=1 Tax=Xenorhabdus mauleonii TaxID=351675 RepID=UPI000B8157DF|nr:YkgJ family cysteine cluster protein [Xenorhabdus mauleonii]